MRILFFSTQAYDSESFQASNHRHGFELHFQQATCRRTRRSSPRASK